MTKLADEKIEYWFIFQNDRLLIQRGDNIQLVTSSNTPTLKSAFLRQHLLGQFENFNVYCAEIPVEQTLPEKIEAQPLRKAMELLGTDWYNMAAKAYTIINWDKNHQYCGRCGNTTTHKTGSFERICNTCGLNFYPRISPSIIVLIHKGDQLLMARSPHFTPGAYGLIAGFVEAGESIETAVHREVWEEVQIKIKNLHYFGSQAWPFPDSLMIAFMAEYDSGEIIIDSNELETAGWYHFNDLPGRPSYQMSMASKLIDHFIAQCEANRGK